MRRFIVGSLFFVVIALMLASCAPPAKTDTTTGGNAGVGTGDGGGQPANGQSCPASCDDGNACTVDACSPDTGYACTHSMQDNCCGNQKCEGGEDFRNCTADCKPEPLSPELQQLLDTAKAKAVRNFKYTYKGPKAQYVNTYYVRDNKIKIEVPYFDRYNGEAFDTVYLNLATQTAIGYCRQAVQCKTIGQQLSFDYDTYRTWVPLTPYDLLQKIDNGVVFETSTVDRKEAKGVRFINSDGVEEKAWLWTYYGMPLKYTLVNANGETEIHEFRELVMNSVSEQDVTVPAK